MKNSNTNWRAVQIPPTREKGLPVAWHAPKDVNVKCMSMGSWHARANQGGKKA